MDALHGFPRSVGDFFTWGPVPTQVHDWGRTFNVNNNNNNNNGGRAAGQRVGSGRNSLAGGAAGG